MATLDLPYSPIAMHWQKRNTRPGWLLKTLGIFAAGARQKTPLRTNIIKGPKHTYITEDTTNDEDEGGNKMTGDMNIDPCQGHCPIPTTRESPRQAVEV